jgi:signal transduction histidine kinase
LLHSGFIADNIHPHFLELASILLNISLLLLFIQLLRIKTLKKSLYFRLLYLIPVYILIGLIHVATPNLTIKIIYALFIVITLSTFIYISINYELKKGIASRLFIGAWVLLTLFQICALAELAFPSNFYMFVQNSEKIGLVFFNIIMALSIGSKLSIYKDEKKIAEKLELQTLQEKEQFIQEQNAILEKLIQERNSELIEKINLSEKHKLEIEQQNEIIKISSVEIEKINQELFKKNLEISEQNKELENHQMILEEIVSKRTKKLRKSKEKAIVAEKLKTSFLNNLTHEINTPMSAIAGYASLITDKSISQETRNEFLGKINKYVDLLLETVDGIVTLSRIQSDIIKCKNTLTNIYQFYLTVIDLSREKITSSNKKIIFSSEYLLENKDVFFLTDSSKTWQIIAQFLDAIIKISNDAVLHLKLDIAQNENAKKSKEMLTITIDMSGKDESNNHIVQRIKEFVKNQEIKTKYTNIIELGIAIAIGLTGVLKGGLSIESNDQKTGQLKIEIPLFNANN